MAEPMEKNRPLPSQQGVPVQSVAGKVCDMLFAKKIERTSIIVLTGRANSTVQWMKAGYS